MKQCARITLFITTLISVLRAYPQSSPLPVSTQSAPFLVPLPAGVQKLGAAYAPALLKEYLRLDDKDQLTPLGQPVNESGITVQRFQQYHQGIKVEHGVYHLHSRGGVPGVISGELYRVPGDLSLKPTLSAEQALGRALAYIGAETYQWQVAVEGTGLKKQRDELQSSFYPQGELVICGVYQRDRVRVTDGGLALAYKFDIYAARPLSRSYVYVDAHSGTVIGEDAILKHADGTGHTRYSGSRTLSTTAVAGGYQLRDATRGQGVEVYNLRGNWDTSSATDFTDADNQWTASEYNNPQKDNAALDALWGASLTYDYFRNVHGRNSIDGNGAKIMCYVHMGQDVINAYWNGSVVLFGDGGTYFDGTQVQPLTCLDITAHEIGHGLCQYTANLTYRYESGALNEGFSDIWGATVENYSGAGKSLWTMGEDANFIIRSFSEPNQFNQPDTYLGQHWFTGEGDNGGVHYNSGVLNHWFYLLSEGKTGVNDHGESYAVTGIGMEKAARIAYRTLTLYLTPNSKYTDACTFSMQAATDLFGASSAEAIQTANAWRAVGVYRVVAAPSALVASAASATQVNVIWHDNAAGETGYEVERTEFGVDNFTRVGTAPADATAYQDQGVPADAVYNYRVRAITGPGAYTAYSNTATVTVGKPPITMRNATTSVCDGVFLDPGGTSNYAHHQYLIMTLVPATAGSKLRLTFTAFDTESGADVLRIYDGSSTYAPLIGTYSGTTMPPAVTATNSGGELTLYFVSNESVTGAGWRATLACVIPPGAPTALKATPSSSSGVTLQWTDNASDETGFAIERSLSPGVGFTQVGTASPGATTYSDRDLATDNWYYYRVRALRGDLYSLYSNEAGIALGEVPILMRTGSLATCNATFMDSGGKDNYANSEYSTLTLSPDDATQQLRVTFSAFSMETCCDYLAVYNGGTTAAPLIGTYQGNTLPPVIHAANPEGKLTFRFYSDGSVTSSGWQATITCVPRLVPVIAAFTPSGGPAGTSVTITGTNLGNASAVKFANNVSAAFTLHPDSRITATVPTGAVAGPIQVVTQWGTATSTTNFAVTKEAASVVLGHLAHTYDGTPKAATATTVPAGLNVSLAYNGLTDVPVNAGTYTVTAIVRSETHQGSATGTLVIRKANATLVAGETSQTYSGRPKNVTFTTTPAGLPVKVVYASLGQPPVNTGSYPFTANITDSNYEGSTQGTLVIGKASQSLTVADLPDRTIGDAPVPLSAMASSGLPVTFAFTGPATLAGNALTATSPGKVTVTAFQDGDQNHFPAAPVVRTFCMLPPKPLVSTAQSMVGVLLTSSGAEGNQWLQNGEPVDGATSTTYQVTGPGSFSVKVSIGGCENVSEVVTLTADEKSFTSRKRFRVFPNPTPNQVTVAYAAPHWAEPPKLIVYSVVGKRIQEHILAWHGELWEVNVRLDGYQAGLYLFSLVEADNQVIQTRRVMKY